MRETGLFAKEILLLVLESKCDISDISAEHKLYIKHILFLKQSTQIRMLQVLHLLISLDTHTKIILPVWLKQYEDDPALIVCLFIITTFEESPFGMFIRT